MDTPPGTLRIGLLNTAGQAAARATEGMWDSLLREAAGPRGFHLQCYELRRGVPADVLDAELDGLIVTGAVPAADAIEDEPSWPALAPVVDWAASCTVSTIWSCLSVHAAVYRLDGIGRRRLPAKLSGVFTCHTVAQDPLLAGCPANIAVPHSRSNGLDEAALVECGYTILTRGAETGVDAFAKTVGQSRFLFLQGHPEYTALTLLREYRRDVAAFIAGERPIPPAVPIAYLDRGADDAMRALAHQMAIRPHPDWLAKLDALVATTPSQPWRAPAVQLCKSWLGLLAAHHRKGLAASLVQVPARC